MTDQVSLVQPSWVGHRLTTEESELMVEVH